MQQQSADTVLRALLEHVPEGIMMIGEPPDFPIVAYSRAARQLLGRPIVRLADLIGVETGSPCGLYASDGRTSAQLEDTPFYRAARQGETVTAEEWVIRRADGALTTVAVSAAPIRSDNGSIAGAVTCWRDITERKHMESELRDTAEQLSLAMRAAQLCLWDYDVSRDQLTWSDECRELFCWPADRTVTQQQFIAAVHAEDRRRVADAIDRALQEYADFDVEFRIVRLDGGERWVAAIGDCFYDEVGRAVRFVGAMIDITARKREAAALRESEERFRQLADAIDDVFWVFDVATGKWLYVSPAYARLYGRDPAELYADPAGRLRAVHAEDRERVERAYARLAHGRTFDHEYRIETPGGLRWVRDRSLSAHDAMGQVVRILGVTQDITDRKATEFGVPDVEWRKSQLSSISRS